MSDTIAPADDVPGLLDGIASTPAMSACWSDRARLQAMLDVEAALAVAEAECGVIPASAVGPIGACCRADLLDRRALSAAAAEAGNLAIPLVRQLTALVRRTDPEASRYVHWGATSQDVQDTGTVLQAMRGLDLLLADLDRLRRSLRGIARDHAATMMIGRTWLQHALPITLGLKAAGWLAAAGRAREALDRAAGDARVLQFGGAAGTLASLGAGDALPVATALARRLGLALPPLPWHTDRTRIAALGAALGLVAGVAGKIARDLSLLSQTEIAEAFEAPKEGRGGSSTMPHKRNPVACAVALSAAVQAPPLVSTLFAAMIQEHERGLGGWHAEWEALPALFRLASASVAAMADALAGLVVDRKQMRASVDRTGGLVMAEAASMALASRIGKDAAHHVVEHASHVAIASGRTLRDALLDEAAIVAHFDASQIEDILRPEQYLGASAHFIDAALTADAAIAGCTDATGKGEF